MAGRKLAKAGKTELRVVFDTNVIHNRSASDVVNQDTVQLIADNAKHHDLTVVWYIPEMVRLERRYQMLKGAQDLMPSIRRMERLLSVNLAITDDILGDRVDANITKQFANLGVKSLPLDVTRVDWNRVQHDAAARSPPFEPGDKEKGFRDLLIGEAFIQLAEDSPTTPKVCRVILVCGDERLRELVVQRLVSRENVKVFPNTEELRGFINTLVSDVTEEFVKRYRDAATKLFFNSGDDQDSLYYSGKVREEILRRFAIRLNSPPEGATGVRQEQWTITASEFVRKAGQRVHWTNRLTIPLTAYRYESSPTPAVVPTGISTGIGAPSTVNFPVYPSSTQALTPSSKVNIASSFYNDASLQALFKPSIFSHTGQAGSGLTLGSLITGRQVEVRKGQATIDVQWTVTVRTTQTLANPRVDDYVFVGITWE